MIKPEYYRDNKREFRWKLTSANGERIHASHEGFKRKRDAVANFELMVDVALAYHPQVGTTTQAVASDTLPDVEQPQIPGVDWDGHAVPAVDTE